MTKINEIVRRDPRLDVETVNADKLSKKFYMQNWSQKGDQKLARQQISSDFFERLHEEPALMENIISCNETWIFQYTAKLTKNEESTVVESKI